MVYTLGYSNSYASLNYIVGGTASRGQAPWIYDLKHDVKFQEFQRKIKTLKVQIPSFSMKGKNNTHMSLDGRTLKWGERFTFADEELKLEVHWQNLEDARTKLLHPYQYGVTRYICDSLSAFLSTDLTTLKYLIMKGIGCSLAQDDPTHSELAYSIRQITKSIYTQIAIEAQKIDSTFYLGDELDLIIFETLKPVVKNVVDRVNKIIARGVTTMQNMAKQYREGIGRVNFQGRTIQAASKTFKIRPSKGFYRIPQNVYDTPTWYKVAMKRLGGGDHWISVDETPDEVKLGILKTAYKHFREVVLISMEPIEGATLTGEAVYHRTAEADKYYTVIRVSKDQTLLEKVKSN